MADRTIREFQSTLPWGAHGYNALFQARTDEGRDTEHALLHITKAAGRLAGIVDGFHHEVSANFVGVRDNYDARKYLADLVICAARIANTWPGGAIDLEQAIAQRLAEKFPPSRGEVK